MNEYAFIGTPALTRGLCSHAGADTSTACVLARLRLAYHLLPPAAGRKVFFFVHFDEELSHCADGTGTQWNRTQRNGTERNGTEPNATQWNRTQRNGTECNAMEPNATQRNGAVRFSSFFDRELGQPRDRTSIFLFLFLFVSFSFFMGSIALLRRGGPLDDGKNTERHPTWRGVTLRDVTS